VCGVCVLDPIPAVRFSVPIVCLCRRATVVGGVWPHARPCMHAKQVLMEDCGYMWAPAERCSPFKTLGRCEGAYYE
jgi:hypothetical protein